MDKPFSSKEAQSSNRINLFSEDDSLIINCEEVAKQLNNFFSCSVTNLNIPDYGNHDSLSQSTDHPNMKAIPSILAIASEYKKYG